MSGDVGEHDVEVVFHTFPLISVGGKPVKDLRAVYSAAPSTETQGDALAAGKAAASDVYGRLLVRFPRGTKENMRLDLENLFYDMLHSDEFVDGLWALCFQAFVAATGPE